MNPFSSVSVPVLARFTGRWLPTAQIVAYLVFASIAFMQTAFLSSWASFEQPNLAVDAWLPLTDTTVSSQGRHITQAECDELKKGYRIAICADNQTYPGCDTVLNYNGILNTFSANATSCRSFNELLHTQMGEGGTFIHVSTSQAQEPKCRASEIPMLLLT